MLNGDPPAGYEPIVAGRYTYESPDQQVRAYIDTEGFDFHVEASPDATPSVIADTLYRVVLPLGFEMLDEDEDEPETTAEGWTRIYLTPIVPAAGVPITVAIPASRPRYAAWIAGAGLWGGAMVLNSDAIINPLLEVFR